MINQETRIETVDKNMLSKSIARRMGMPIIDVIQMIDIFEDEIITSVKENKKVQLNGFLIFMPKNVGKSKIISALDHKEYEIPARRTVDVRVGKYFKDSIKDAYTEVEEVSDDNTEKQTKSRRSKK